MKITFGDFILQPGMNTKDRWDVLRRKQIAMAQSPMMQKRYGNIETGTIVGEKEEEIAYDLQLENAVKKIISYTLADNEETTDLKGFLLEYKKQIEKLENLLK